MREALFALWCNFCDSCDAVFVSHVNLHCLCLQTFWREIMIDKKNRKFHLEVRFSFLEIVTCKIRLMFYSSHHFSSTSIYCH